MASSNGRRPPRVTRRAVLIVDRIASTGITVGGVAVLGCVLGIVVYLVSVVVPLFWPARAEHATQFSVLSAEQMAAEVLFFDVDEYRSMATVVFATGAAVGFSLDDGRIVWQEQLFPEEPRVVAHSRALGGDGAVALADGTIRLIHTDFAVRFLNTDEVDETTRDLAPGGRTLALGGVVERTQVGDLRLVKPKLEAAKPITLPYDGSAIRLVDFRPSDSGSRLAVLFADGRLLLNDVFEREDFLSGETVRELGSKQLRYEPAAPDPPDRMLLATNGQLLYFAWNRGVVARYSLQRDDLLRLDERVDVVEDASVHLTSFGFLPGEQSILIADSSGATSVWFAAPVSQSDLSGRSSVDGRRFVAAHRLVESGAAVNAYATSSRDRTVLLSDVSGGLRLVHATSSRHLLDRKTTGPLRAVHITPKADGIVTLGADGVVSQCDLINPHPETTIASLFGRVWYEGYEAPGFSWQSSGATDDFEPKLSLAPLVFGSLKATFYTLLFAVPIALLAAIYTSEFLDRRLRPPIKSTIEMMASLPSVVLGFIAALVLAPVVESSLVAIVTVFWLVPLAVLMAGHVWQALPRHLTLPLVGRPQLALIAAVTLGAMVASPTVGRALEGWLFGSDVRGWLDGRHGGAAPGIALLAAPTLLLLLLGIDIRWLAPAASRVERRLRWRQAAALSIGRFVGLCVVAAALTAVIAYLGASAGFDIRHGLVGTYVQRNALIVGFVMGFAVIPIIYTLADDALQAVPATLRSASLGCGATVWQTATRVVLPVAFPGIFSALMVGLGRAVGETMIVLMAAGNTPIMDLNLFSGLRTLSANIAVELPEAPRDGTLYRVLFLSAFTLFVMTLVINTIAELVRQHYRKRTRQL